MKRKTQEIKENILVVCMVLLFMVMAGWYSKADAQVVVVPDSDGTPTELYCFTIGDTVFCE